MNRQNIGFALFLCYLFLTLLELIVSFGIGLRNWTIDELIVIIEMLSTLGLIGKALVLAMFGLLFTTEEEQTQEEENHA